MTPPKSGINNEKQYLLEYNAYEKRMAKYNAFNIFISVVYMLYVLFVYYFAIPYMNGLKNDEWYQGFMDFIFVPAPHICISIYLYGMGVFIITMLLIYIRFKVIVPERFGAYDVIKASFKSLTPTFYIPMGIAIIVVSLGAIGKFIYMGLVWFSSISFYISSYVLLTQTEALTEKPKNPVAITSKVRQQDTDLSRKNCKTTSHAEKHDSKGIEEEKQKTRELILKEAMNELNSLIGMDELKIEVKKFVADIEMQKKKEQYGINAGKKSSLHMVFEGPPGTGKTTVARIMGKILYGIGYLPTGELLEVDRSDLIGEYVGHTAPKVKKVFEAAKGGVIFIDEAYSLTPQKSGNGFENEAIDTIVKLMEDNREDTVVIFAGYPDQMERFVNSNPGLQSRIPYTFTFEPYSAEELYEIFLAMLAPTGYKIATENMVFVKECIFNLSPYLKDSNARDIRTFHEKMGKEQNYRLSKEDSEKSSEKDVTKRLTDKEKAAIIEAEKENMMTFKRYEIEYAYRFIMNNKLRILKQAGN